MKTLITLTLSVMLLSSIGSANARSAYGYRSFSSRVVYRNPYAAMPSIGVHDYFRRNGTYVAPHVRTAPNWTETDNLSYRDYGTVAVPRDTEW